ncbi:hypothetical protein BGX38DRAFT_1158278 [Terfezia claveryi]|nr:hypothetical protein BGX38DRAFT_1158278 [Terfezia claveryi]
MLTTVCGLLHWGTWVLTLWSHKNFYNKLFDGKIFHSNGRMQEGALNSKLLAGEGAHAAVGHMTISANEIKGLRRRE